MKDQWDLDNPDVMDQKAIIGANGSIGFIQILIGGTDSNFRDLHVHFNPNATVSTR
jgi:hypothetical protein